MVMAAVAPGAPAAMIVPGIVTQRPNDHDLTYDRAGRTTTVLRTIGGGRTTTTSRTTGAGRPPPFRARSEADALPPCRQSPHPADSLTRHSLQRSRAKAISEATAIPARVLYICHPRVAPPFEFLERGFVPCLRFQFGALVFLCRRTLRRRSFSLGSSSPQG
jgi:hypothetical protein